MTGYVRDGGIWKLIKTLSVKDAGVWKSASGAWVRDAGVWKKWFTSGPPTTGLWGWWSAAEAYTQTSGTPSTLITTDGTAIGSLKDLSGNGRHFYQTTTAAKPAFKTNIVNGLPSWRTANGDYMDTTGNAPPGSPYDVSIYCVIKPSGFEQNAGVLCTNNDSSTYQIWSDNAASTGQWLARYGNLSGASQASLQTYANGSVAIMAISMKLSNKIYHAKNGGSALASTGNAPSTPGGGGTVMRLCRFAGNGYFIGDMCEMLFYTSYHGNMATGDGLAVRQYLNAKYNLGFSL